MRILIHEYAGYPFSLPLGRALAHRGYTVQYVYCASLQTTPRGLLQRRPDDPAGFEIVGLHLRAPLEKYAFIQRWRQENEYGRLLVDQAGRFGPDVVLSGDAPLDAQRRLVRACRAGGVRFVFWLQDLIGIATHKLLRRKIPGVGALVGRYYLNLERALLRESEAVVLITDDFRPILQGYGVGEERLHVIENWAPLEDVPVHPRANPWAVAQGLADKRCFLYSGTLGMKHNPDLLLQLARQLRSQPDVRVVVVSQGLGADWLAQEKAVHGLDNLLVMGFQPFERHAEVLATAEVLVAVLEPEAGVFSVPSKVLTYLCAARPLLLAVPPENLAARIVVRQEAGVVVPPSDTDAFVAAALALLEDGERREALGRHARAYAEAAFDIERIADAFEKVLVGEKRL